MGKNPFGGEASFNNLDDVFMEALGQGRITPYQGLALRIIKMSIRDYLYFGLGENYITPEKFLEAYQYLFQVRASDSNTWGQINPRDLAKLSTDTIKHKCFDTHYEATGLDMLMPMSKFLSKLVTKRTNILSKNRLQIKVYLVELREQEWKSLGCSTDKKAVEFSEKDISSILTEPSDPIKLAQVLLYTRIVPKVCNKIEYETLLF